VLVLYLTLTTPDPVFVFDAGIELLRQLFDVVDDLLGISPEVNIGRPSIRIPVFRTGPVLPPVP